jgi:acyl carrier protein
MIKEMIARKLNLDVSEITDYKHLIQDLGADSLDTVELVMELETEYDIDIADEDAETLVTVGAIKQYIEDNA